MVASAPLAFGVTLSHDNVTEVPWARRATPGGRICEPRSVAEGRPSCSIVASWKNEPILKSKVTGPGQRASLSALLEEGKRAVTVRVDDVKGVAGFVLPGDRVDVVLIRRCKGQTGPPENIF